MNYSYKYKCTYGVPETLEDMFSAFIYVWDIRVMVPVIYRETKKVNSGKSGAGGGGVTCVFNDEVQLISEVLEEDRYGKYVSVQQYNCNLFHMERDLLPYDHINTLNHMYISNSKTHFSHFLE